MWVTLYHSFNFSMLDVFLKKKFKRTKRKKYSFKEAVVGEEENSIIPKSGGKLLSDKLWITLNFRSQTINLYQQLWRLTNKRSPRPGPSHCCSRQAGGGGSHMLTCGVPPLRSLLEPEPGSRRCT